MCVRAELAAVPDVPMPPGFSVREMDPADPAEVDRWLAIHNIAFEQHWTEANHRIAMVENPVVIVDRTFLAERDGEVVGTASIGRFRANPDVGVGHYLTVSPTVQRQGLGLALCSHRYRLLAETVGVAEAQTHLHRVGSLRAHFACGFAPKVGLDPWNSARPTRGVRRWWADRGLARLHADWCDSR